MCKFSIVLLHLCKYKIVIYRYLNEEKLEIDLTKRKMVYFK